jgi:hypothetical protein
VPEIAAVTGHTLKHGIHILEASPSRSRTQPSSSSIPGALALLRLGNLHGVN